MNRQRLRCATIGWWLGNEKGFVHKKIFGAVSGGIKGFFTGGPLGALSGGLSGFAGGGGQAVPIQQSLFPINVIPGAKACPAGEHWHRVEGRCVPWTVGHLAHLHLKPKETRVTFDPTALGPLPGPAFPVSSEFGQAVMGQYGAALQPGRLSTQLLRCPRGTVLGTDELCYNKRDLRNSERKWPVGRRPLLTGGEMRCISIASAAAKKLQRKEKQLQAMGMLKKPTRRRVAALPSGHHAHVDHD